MPNRSGSPVLHDIHRLDEVHLGIMYHFDNNYATSKVRNNFDVKKLNATVKV